MKILATSDLHRGYSDQTHQIHKEFARGLAACEWDVLVLAGDLASHKRHQFCGVMKWARDLAGERPVLVVRGNHDLWDHEYSVKDLSLMFDEQEEWMRGFGVHHLQHRPIEIGDVTFVGWDGWWANAPLDIDCIPRQCAGMPSDIWLKHTHGIAFGDAQLEAELAAAEDRHVVAVTHFPVAPNEDLSYGGNPRHWEFIAPHIDILIYGHSHKRRNEIIDGVRVFNAGNDYDKPRSIIIDVEGVQ